MRRHSSFATIVMLTLIAPSVSLWANRTSLPRPRVRTANSASSADRQQAADLLNGRQVVLRLYPDWKTDPKAYVTLRVPLEGLDVTFDAVRLAYAQRKSAGRDPNSLELSDEAQTALDQELQNAVLVVMPTEQQDAEITTVLHDCTFGAPYGAGLRLTLWPGAAPQTQVNPCLFLDALQQPIPNAEVEILLADNPRYMNAQARAWITKTRLDSNGRMQPPRLASSSRLHYFLFVVTHPDCGPAPALGQSGSSQPGRDHFFAVGVLPREKWCVFVDALSNPMAGATAQVFHGRRWESRDPIPLETIPLDQGGRLRPPQTRTLLEECCLLISDPNYGNAVVEPCERTRYGHGTALTACVVPLVRAATKADERSVWGRVLDPNNRPIEGALVKSESVVVSGHGMLFAFFPESSQLGKYAKVPTDSEGRFAMHLPLAKQDGALGRPVPPGAQYSITIEAPPELGLSPYKALLTAGQEHTITLEVVGQGSRSFSGTLVFEDEFGPVTDPNKLKEVTLSIQTPWGSGRHTRVYGPGQWMGQSELAFGVYSAAATWAGKHYVFEPVEVTPESPATITFKPREIAGGQIIFCGRVIHGITGEPVAGALVMRRPDTSLFGQLHGDDAEQVFYLGPELDPDSLLFKLLEQYPDLGAAETDASGRFETQVPAVSSAKPAFFDSLIAIKKDFLGAEQQRRVTLPGRDASGQPRYEEFKPDRTGRVFLPDMKLFPAGTVLVEPNVPGLGEVSPERAVSFSYFVAENDSAPWLKDLWAAPARNRGGNVFQKSKLPVNLLQSIYVPADVELTLCLSRAREEFAPVLINGVRLRQGQVLDLGRVEFIAAMQICVRVIDSAGKPLEGINVVRFDDRHRQRSRATLTDSEGIVQVWVAPNSYGRLAVKYRNQDARSTVRAEIPYRVGGQEDAGREFLLPLSDEFLAQLLQAGQSR